MKESIESLINSKPKVKHKGFDEDFYAIKIVKLDKETFVFIEDDDGSLYRSKIEDLTLDLDFTNQDLGVEDREEDFSMDI